MKGKKQRPKHDRNSSVINKKRMGNIDYKSCFKEVYAFANDMEWNLGLSKGLLQSVPEPSQPRKFHLISLAQSIQCGHKFTCLHWKLF